MSTAVPALVAAMGSVAHAGGLPTGGQVIGGSVTINTPSATRMQITSTTARSAISWQDFSIGSGDSVNITQPNGGTQLESVRGTNVSQIFGALTSNGSIVVANPNGIWFGPNAQVDVAGLAAVAASPTNADVQTFISGGHLNVSQAGNANAAVVNQGHITITNAGLGAFVAPGVRNDGIIQAKLGTVQLSSGTTATLDFYGDGLISIAVSGQTLAQAIDPSTGKPMTEAVGNTGTINADGGTVLLTANVASNVVNDAINVSGVVQAQSVSTQDGMIVLDGGGNGNVQVAGSLDASGTGAGQTGGHVQVTGQTVTLAGTAVIDASGDQGGGKVYVGGGPHGQGTSNTATTTTVAKGATIRANAITAGNGGTIAIWSQQHTSFDGIVEAAGGTQGGNGGFVETSGAKLTVGGDATVNTSAPRGAAGTWLLDPNNVTIATSGGDITPSTITTALSSGNVEIDTENGINGTAAGTSGTGTITVNSAITYSSGNALGLIAENDIDVNASIQNSGSGAINLVAGWNPAAVAQSVLSSTTYINTFGTTANSYGQTGSNGAGAGSVAIGNSFQLTTVAVGSANGTTTVLGNNVSVNGERVTVNSIVNVRGGAQIGFNDPATAITSASGNIVVDALGTVSLTGNSDGWAQIGHGGYNAGISYFTSGGSVSLTGNITVNAAAVTLTGGNFDGGEAQIGHGGISAFANSAMTSVVLGGAITVNATGSGSTGNVTLDAGGQPQSYAQIGHGGYDLNVDGNTTSAFSISGNIAVNATGTVTLEGATGSDDNYAQIGHGGTGVNANSAVVGTASGNIAISAAALNLNGGSGFRNYTQIGNGADSSFGAKLNVSGNIDVRVTDTLSANTGTTYMIGSAAQGTVSDPIFVEAGDLSGFSPGDVGNTAGGQVVVAVTDPAGYTAPAFSVSGGNAFALLTEGPLTIGGAISASGGGALDLVSGWNGTAGVPATPGATTFDLSTTTGALQSGAYGAGGNGITLSASVGGGGAVTFAGPVSLGGNVTVSSGGTLDFLSTLAGNGDNITFVDDTAPIFGSTVSSIGVATLAPFTTTDTIAVGNSTQQALATANISYDFSTGDAATLVAVANTVGIGTGSNTGSITATQLTLTPGLVLTNGGTGAITITGAISAGGAVVQSGSGGIAVDAGISGGATGPVLLLSAGSIDVNTSIQNSGSGAISLVAGWDGTAPNSASDVSNLYSGATHFGSNGGNVLIGNGTQSSGIAVGNASGTTTVLGNNITLTAATGNSTNGGFAQIGYALGTGAPVGGSSATGAIVVDAKGNVALTAGGVNNNTSDNYAQIGHGGPNANPSGQMSGSITVTAGGAVSVIGGPSDGNGGGVSNYAQIGHGGDGDYASHAAQLGTAGDLISVTAGGAVSLQANGAYAQIGDGGKGVVGPTGITITTDITVQGSSVTVHGGSNNDAYAQIGNGGEGIGGDAGTDAITGNISVTATAGGVSLTGGSLEFGYAQIGHGGAEDFFESNATSITTGGSITVNATGNINLSAAAGFGASYAQIGHGGFWEGLEADSGKTGPLVFANTGAISVNSSGGAVVLTAGTGTGGADYAQIGHGGLASWYQAGWQGPPGSTTTRENSGGITVGAHTSIALSGGSNGGSYAQIGNGGALSMGGASTPAATVAWGDFGDINITAASLTLAGGDSNGDGAMVGGGGLSGTLSATFFFGLSSAAVGDVSGNTLATLTGSLGASGANNYLGNFTGTANGATGLVSVGASSIVTSAGINLGGNTTFDTSAGNGVQTFGGALNAGSNNITINTGTGNVTLGGVTAGALTLNNTGIATETLDAGTYNIGSSPITWSAANGLTLNGSGGALVFDQSPTFSGAITLASDTLLEAPSASGTITFGSALSYSNSLNLAVLSGGAIDVNAAIQNAGAGNVSLVAGWDGTAPNGAGDVSNLISGTHYGSSGGNVVIGNGSQGSTVAVGSESGATTVLGDNVTLQGSGVSDSNYLLAGHNGTGAQIGFNVPSGGTAAATGNIMVDALGTVLLQGGSGNAAFAQIGHGGVGAGSNNTSTNTQTLTGGIVVNAAAVTLASNSIFDAYAQIGHGGLNFASGDNVLTSLNLGGDITVNATGTIALHASTSYVQIGHGGDDAFISASVPAGFATTGNITVGAASLTITAGSSANNYAQIGHGEDTAANGENYTGGVSGNVDITVTSTLSTSGQNILIGSRATGTVTTPLFIEARDFSGSFGPSSVEDTAGGQVVVALTDPAGYSTGGFTASGGNTFALLTKGELSVTGTIGSDGTIDLIGGWNGTSGVPSAGGTFDLSTGTGALKAGAFGNGSAGSNGISLGANVSTSGSGGVTLGGPVTLTAGVDVTGSTVTFDGTVDGAHNLTVTGNAVFGGAVGGATPLGALAVSGTTAIDGGTVDTTGGQTYTGAATLVANTTFTAGSGSTIAFDSTVTGASDALDVTQGATTFDGAATVGALSVQAATIDGGTITTTAGQTYGGAVTLGANTTLTAGSGSTIAFDGTVTGSGDTLAIIQGATVFSGGVSVGTLTTQAVTFDISSGSVATSGGQTYSGAATLDANTTLADSGGNAIQFGSTLAGGGKNLTIIDDALPVFGGTIGGTIGTATLAPFTTTDTIAVGNSTQALLATGQNVSYDFSTGAVATLAAVASTIAIGTGSNTGNITETTLTLTPALVLTNGGAGGIAISGALTAGGLTANAGSGGIALDANVTTTAGQTYGGAVTLGASTITLGDSSTIGITFGNTVTGTGDTLHVTQGATTFSGAVSVGSLVAQAVTFDITSGSVSTTAGQTYSGAVTLGADTTLVDTSTGLFGVTFASTVDSNGTPHALTINAADSTDGTAFENSVGAGNALSSLSVTGGTDFASLATLAATTGSQSYSGHILFGRSVELQSADGGAIDLLGGSTGTIDLLISTTGTVSLAGTFGTLHSLTVDSGVGAVTLSSSITTQSAQIYDHPVILAADVTLTGTSVDFNTPFATIDSSHTGSASDDHSLIVSGAATFGETVGGNFALGSLLVTGTTALNGGSVDTTGSQTYSGAITLGGNTTLDSAAGDGAIFFGGSVNGASDTLTINTGTGGVVFSGFDFNVAGLSIIGPETLDTGTYTLTGGTIANSSGIGLEGNLDFAQNTTLAGAVTLDADTSIVTTSGSAAITFGSTVDGAHALTVTTTGQTSFGGSIGSTQALSSLDIAAGGATTVLGGTLVQTTGSQTYGNPLSLTNSNGFTFESTNGGTISLPAITANGGLSVIDATGTTDLATSLVETTGSQVWDTNLSLPGSGGEVFYSTTGDVTVDGAISYTSNGSGGFAFLAGGNVVFNANVQNSGNAEVDAVAGYDGSHGLSGGVFTFANLQTGDYGNNGGSVSINGGTVGASVGSKNGPTNIAGDNVILTGGSALGGHAQIGFHGADASGAITVDATGAVTLDGGSATNTYAQIGHGGGGIDQTGGPTSGTLLGSIAVTAGSVTLAGGSGSGAYTQIGHGGAGAYSGNTTIGTIAVSGGITVDATGNISLAGGNSGNNAYAQIGHGGFNFAAGTTAVPSLGGNIVVNAGGNLSLAGGSGTHGYGQIGMRTGDAATVSNSNIDVRDSGTLAVSTGTGGGFLIGESVPSGSLTSGDNVFIETANVVENGGTVDVLPTNSNLEANLGGDTGAGTVAFAVTGAGGLTLTAVSYNGAGALEFLTTSGALTVGGIVNSGSGAIGLVAGWDGVTGLPSSPGAAAFSVDTFFVSPGTLVGSSGTVAVSLGGNLVSNGGDIGIAGVTTLATNVSIGAGTGDITFQGTVNAASAGGEGLIVGTAGNVAFAGSVGGSEPLASLSVTGGAIQLFGGTVATTGNQTFGGAVSLENTSGTTFTASSTFNAGAIDFTSTLDGVSTASLTIAIGASSVTFGGSVGATGPFSSITDKATDTVIGGATMATTGGSQQYLSDNTTLTNTSGTTFSDSGGGYIQFSALDGATAGTVPLTVSLTGNVVDFSGAVGANAALESIVVTGGKTLFDTTVINTTGTQEYDAVSVRETNVTLTASTVTFGDMVDSFGGLTTNGDSLTVSGNASFGGTVGATYALGSLDVTGGTTIGTTAINTTGAQTYGGAVTLAANTTLTGSAVDFDSTVDSDNSGNHRNLTVSGDATFGSNVGAITALGSLGVTGTTDINAASIDTTGGQTYGGAVTLSADTALTATTVDFQSTVDSDNSGTDWNLSITGNATFGGDVGAITALNTVGVTGTTAIDAASIDTTGGQTYGGAVTLGTSAATLSSSDRGAIDLLGTVDGASALLISTSGTVSLAGTVGGSTPLTSLTVDTSRGDLTISSTGIITTGAQLYDHPVVLAANVTMTGTSVTFDFPVDSDSSGNKRNLTVSGDATFGDNVGATTALGSLGVTGTTEIDGASIITTSGQTYSGAVTLANNVTLSDSSASGVDFVSTVDSDSSGTNWNLSITGNATFGDNVGATTVLGSLGVTGTTDIDAASIDTTGGQTYSGAVTLGNNVTLTGSTVTFVSAVGSSGHLAPGPSFVSDDYDLTVSGNASFGGAVGQAIFIFPATLGTLDVTGTTALNGGFVGTTGTQTYGGTVTLGAGATLSSELSTGDAIIFDGPVVSSTALYSLTTETAGGNTVFKSDVGVGGLYSLTVNGGLAVFEPGAAGSAIDILTGGAAGQNYNGGISLAGSGGDAVLEVWNISGTIVIGADSTYDSAGNLSLLSVGGITINHLLQNSGRGAINVVAGWGLTGLSGSGGGQTFDFASVGAPGTGYGSNGGSVTIDGSSGLAAVGSALGATNVAGDNVVVNGDTGGAQIGFNLGASGTTATGAITVLAANNITLAGGSGTEAFAQIGHGGELVDTNVNLGAVTLGGDIDVSAVGNIVLKGGSGSASAGTGAYAQIGHGGLGFLANTGASDTTIGAVSITGDITVTSTGTSGSISLTGGDQWAYAQIGHGGMAFAENQTRSNNETLASVTLNGDITVGAAHDISLTGGTAADDAFDAYAQIGHGGNAALSDIGTALTVNGATSIGGTISVVSSSGSVSLGGKDDYAYAQIGHGGLTFGTFGTFADVSVTGAITVSGATGVNVSGGAGSTAPGNTNTGAYAQIGDGGEAVLSGATAGAVTLGGAIAVDGGTGGVDLTGGSASGNTSNGVSTGDSYAQIGLGGDSAFIGANFGSLTVGGATSTIGVSTGGAVALAGGSGGGDYAQVGDGGFQFASGATVGTTVSSVFSGGAVIVSGDITVGAASVTLLGDPPSGGAFAYAQIGHGGGAALYNATAGDVTVGGDISVTASAGDISLTAGTGDAAYAQVGHGGAYFGSAENVIVGSTTLLTGTGATFGSVTLDGNIAVEATHSGGTSGGVFLTGDVGGAYAQIGDGGQNAFFGTTCACSGGPVTLASLTVGGAGETITVTGDDGIGVSSTSGGYAQIGDGGLDFAELAQISGAATIAGDIGVDAIGGGVTLTGDAGSSGYAQIGHGGADAFGNATAGSLGVSGGITVTGDDDVDVNGGSHFGAYAQIGHGGDDFAEGARISGATTVGGDISVDAISGGVSVGGGLDAYAQIGHGGAFAFDGIGTAALMVSGDITVTAGDGSVSLIAAPSGYAQIGHGGADFAQGAQISSAATIDGDISVGATNGGVTLTGDLGGGGYAQIGDGGLDAFEFADLGSLTIGGAGADITVTADGAMSLHGGSGENAYAQIGHGGKGFASDATVGTTAGTVFTSGGVMLTGDITVGAVSVTLSSGSSNFAYAQIGHGGGAALYNATAGDVWIGGDVSVTASDGNIALTAGSGEATYAQIGHGGAYLGSAENVVVGGRTILTGTGATFASVALDGNITVEATNSGGTSGGVFLTGGADPDAYAQIGHGGSYAFAGAASCGCSGGPITLASLTLGGAGEAITVLSDGNISLTSGSSEGAYAQIGHGGYGFASEARATNAITVASDITVTTGNGEDFTAVGGSGDDAYVQVGHGGLGFAADSSFGSATIGGNIDVSAPNGYAFVVSGSNGDAYAQIGHGGAFAFTDAAASPTYAGIVSVNAGELDVGSFSPVAYGVIGSGDPVPTVDGGNGTLNGTVDVTTVGDQNYFVDFTDVILAGGTYSTSNGTISFSDGPSVAPVVLSGSITINDSTTEWGQVTFANGVTAPNMTFALTAQNDTTFDANVGSATQPVGTLSVSGGNNFTIASIPPAEVYVDFFTESGNTGITDFGHTLNVQNQAVLSGTNIGDLVCAGGGISCILGSGTLNGVDITILLGGGFDFDDQTLHLFDYQYTLSNPGQNLLAGGGSNPQAGCSDEVKAANGGSCPAGGDATGFGNAFLSGSKP